MGGDLRDSPIPMTFFLMIIFRFEAILVLQHKCCSISEERIVEMDTVGYSNSLLTSSDLLLLL